MKKLNKRGKIARNISFVLGLLFMIGAPGSLEVGTASLVTALTLEVIGMLLVAFASYLTILTQGD